ncbi:MAG: hypothetical protein ACYSUR_07210 [Planctomycetota bacterium]|jgi:hypothetical protein
MQMFLADFIESMFSMPGIIFTIGGSVAIVGIVAASITSVAVNRAREKTRREIAAYVAEGSIEPEKAVELLKATGEKAED